MKKNLFLLFLGCMVFSQTFAYTSLTSQEVKNYQSGGFIVSDNHSNYEVCNVEKQTNDTKYPSYNRSECFSESGTFKYFICEKNVNCAVVGSGVGSNTSEIKVTGDTPVNTSKSTLSAKNKAQLDAFIKKLSSQKNKLSEEAYEKMLGDTLSKYEKLALKYQKNKQVSDILNYLVEQTKILQSEIPPDDVTNFWCELDEDNCKNTTTPTLTQTGSVPKTATGKIRIPEEKICTMEYAPVCGVDGNTYSNACQAGDIVVKHKGACNKETLSISSETKITQTPITKAQRDAFMEEVKKDLASRITEDKDFVYIDGELAITKAKYDHKNFGKNNDPYETVSSEAEKLVCPTGYEFARVKPYFLNHGDYSELDVSPLTLETLGYYVNQVANGEKKISSTVSAQQKVNSLYRGGEIVDNKYRLTANTYDGSFRGKKPGSIDVCTQEFGHQWQISTSQAGLDATKKIIKEKNEGYTGGDEYGNGMKKTTTIFYNEIWDTTGETLTKPNGNNCFSYQVVKDGYQGNYKSYTHEEGRYSWTDSTQTKLLKGAPVLKSCTEKAYVACEHNGKPDNYEEGHLSFTGVRVGVSSMSSGINPIKHITETGVAVYSAEMEDIKSTGFFVGSTNVNKNFGGSEQGIRYWSGRMQIMYFDLTKAGEDWKNPDAKYTTYNTRTFADFYQNSINPVLCQKVGTQASKTYPKNILPGEKSTFPVIKNVNNISLQDYDYLYFQRPFRHNLDSNVFKYGQENLEHANAYQYYRYRGRQFLLHTFELIKNTELNIADNEKTHKLTKPNLDYYIPIWDNGYYFPVSEKK